MRMLSGGTLGLTGAALVSHSFSQPLLAFDGSGLYQPHAAWIGRLLLPEEASWPGPDPPPRDWVWIEVQQAPPSHRALIGQRIPLTWKAGSQIDRLVRLVSTDVRFTSEARQAASAGWDLPERLEGRRAVGPLTSLAGARSQDDVQVSLEQVQVDPMARAGAVLRLGRPPIQITGQYKALVQVIGPDRPLAPIASGFAISIRKAADLMGAAPACAFRNLPWTAPACAGHSAPGDWSVPLQVAKAGMPSVNRMRKASSRRPLSSPELW